MKKIVSVDRDDYLNEEELMRLVKKSKKTLQNWRSLRIGPECYDMGSEFLYPKEAVARWMESRRIKTAA